MYLSSVKIKNFRKFGLEDNVVSFASDFQTRGETKCLNSTLIVGQNNAGKTSVIKALEKAANEDFCYTDFNYYSLRDLLEKAIDKKDILKEYIDKSGNINETDLDFIWSLVPSIEIEFTFHVDVDADSADLLTNIGSIITNDIPNDGLVSCVVKYETKNLLSFIKGLCEIVHKNTILDDKFSELISFLSDFSKEYNVNCYLNSDEPEPVKFKLRDLVKVNSVSFEKLHSPSRLTDAFNKIYRYRVNKDDKTKVAFDKEIENINKNIDQTIKTGKDISDGFNTVLEKTTDASKVSMDLKANLNIDSLLNNIIKYVYKDGGFEIPEDQFGMGYTNLMLIISELVEYVDNSPENDFYNKINLLIIEEPESYMHPQMQKVFIENINSAFYTIIGFRACSNDKINCQLVLTTHSPYVLSGKLGAENSFNNINYIRFRSEKCSVITRLLDEDISTSADDFEFLKRYFKFKCCELFFADAAIFIEGQAEETILPFYIDNDPFLKKKYISFFNINGTYFRIYEKLINVLGIPVVILTDLDIKGSKDSDAQITSLKDKCSTNPAIKSFGIDIKKESNKTKGKIFVSTQSFCEGAYPTSFEEAIILANSDNDLVKDALKETLQSEHEKWESSISDNSHAIQNHLSGHKGRFASTLLYKMIKNESDKKKIVFPQYIVDGFTFIKRELGIKDGVDNE